MAIGNTVASMAAAVWCGAIALGVMSEPWAAVPNVKNNSPKPVTALTKVTPIIVPLPKAAAAGQRGQAKHLAVDISVKLPEGTDGFAHIPVDTALRDLLLSVVQHSGSSRPDFLDRTILSGLLNAHASGEPWWPEKALISVKRVEVLVPK